MDDFETVLSKINAKLANAALFYLSNDPERALGLEHLLPNYHVVHIDASQYGEQLMAAGVAQFCLDDETTESTFRSSLKLINAPEFQTYYSQHKKDKNYIQTFKISPAFEKAVTKMGATLANTAAELNRKFENKISQYHELSRAGIRMPETVIGVMSELDFGQLRSQLGEQIVVQFDRGHTGESTFFVDSEAEWSELRAQNTHRTARVSRKLEGLPYTINCCVTSQGTYMGGLSFQLTGVTGLTARAGGTVGNDWSYRAEMGAEQLGQLKQLVTDVGQAMATAGYRGMFGIDLIVSAGQVYLIEINARQPASIPMWTKIQLEMGEVPLAALHLAEFLDIGYDLDVQGYNERNMQPQNFAQVFLRSDADYQIKTHVAMGSYRLQGDNAAVEPDTGEILPGTIFLDEDRDKPLIWQKTCYNIGQINEGAMLLLTPALNRQIDTGDELARLQLRQSAVDEQGQVAAWVVEALLAVKRKMI